MNLMKQCRFVDKVEQNFNRQYLLENSNDLIKYCEFFIGLFWK